MLEILQNFQAQCLMQFGNAPKEVVLPKELFFKLVEELSSGSRYGVVLGLAESYLYLNFSEGQLKVRGK